MDIIEKIRKESFSLTDKIIKKVGPRLAGSRACKESGEMLYEEMIAFADKVEVQEFTIHQGAFLGWIKLLVLGYLLSAILLWYNQPLIAGILLVICLIIMVFQFFLYKHFIDIFYPKAQAENIIGTIEPTDEVKQQIIISGHHDSARIFNFFIHQPKLYNLRVTGGIALIIIALVLSFVSLIPMPDIVILIINIFVSVGFLLTGQMWFFASDKGTPGAGDNLISSALAIKIGAYYKELKNQGKGLKHTRIIAVSFDAEEEGLRGAYAYANAHKDELNQVDTYLLNVDCPYYKKDIFFLTSDINGSVSLSEELAQELVDISTSLNITTKHQPIAFLTGGTDAGELAKVGVKATTLMAMPWSNNERASVYHTPNDTTDNIEVECIDAIISIFTTFIDKKDAS